MIETAGRDTDVHRAIIGGQPMTSDTAGAEFAALADESNAGRSPVAFTSGIYHQVIGMGYAAVPLLLDRLGDGCVDWV